MSIFETSSLPRCFLSSCVAAIVLAGCSSAPLEDDQEGAAQADELRTTAAERVGDIALGETKTIAYSSKPLHRALRVHAAQGDTLDAWVRGGGLDPKAWIVRASDSRTLASNDDADETTKDAHVTVIAPATGDYLIVLREMDRVSGPLTVSLGAGGAPSVPDDAALLHGFVAGQRVVAKGVGTEESRVPNSYQCKRQTKDRLPCGGWAVVTAESGKTNVSFGIMGHYDYWESVSGHHYLEGMNQVPPPPYSRFWDEAGNVQLDDAGKASFTRIARYTDGRVSSTYHYELEAGDGALTIRFEHVGDTTMCSYTNETCALRVIAP